MKFKDDADNKGKELRIKLWIIMNNFWFDRKDDIKSLWDAKLSWEEFIKLTHLKLEEIK